MTPLADKAICNITEFGLLYSLPDASALQVPGVDTQCHCRSAISLVHSSPAATLAQDQILL